MNKTLSILAISALALGACGGDDDSADDIGVTGAWARTSPAGVEIGAAYFLLTSSTDDQLVGVMVDAEIADHAEMHEMVPADDEMTGDTMATDTRGAMTMQQVDTIDLPAGETIVFEPGGYHVMLIDLAEPLVSGETIELTLEFAEADPMTVEVEVRDEAP